MRLLGVLLGAVLALPADAQEVASATFADPTRRYAHAVLGDDVEWGTLEVEMTSGLRHTIRLPQDHVFEDVAPRLWDVDGDGSPEIVVVETDVALGAALAIYRGAMKIAETPHIGQRNRWLAPIGAADLDGDGAIEIAFVDRPHLRKTIRVWRLAEGKLVEIAQASGFSNHRIGEDDIAGGIRTCGGQPKMVLATGNWARVVHVGFDGSTFTITDAGAHQGRGSFAKAMACP